MVTGDLAISPEQTEIAALGDAAGAIASRAVENFPVLTLLVPRSLRPDFQSIYAFCRVADDCADETGADAAARARSLMLLRDLRSQLDGIFAGDERAGWPCLRALPRTIRRHSLPRAPFDALLDAFEQDQRKQIYDDWHDLLGYCRGSANPVGHLVLMLGGRRPPSEAPGNAPVYDMSDLICTGLQLANFWQDVRRDLFERDRVYLPMRETGLDAAALRSLEARADDPEARLTFIRALRPLVARTREMFTTAAGLSRTLGPDIGPSVWCFHRAGLRVLDRIEAAGCTTLWRRPVVTAADKAAVVFRAILLRCFGAWR